MFGTKNRRRVADMDDQDNLIADLVRQRDEALALVSAAAAQVEEFRARVTGAQAEAAAARRDADQVQTQLVRLRAELANAQAVSVPMYAPDSPTEELFIGQVISLQVRGAA